MYKRFITRNRGLFIIKQDNYINFTLYNISHSSNKYRDNYKSGGEGTEKNKADRLIFTYLRVVRGSSKFKRVPIGVKADSLSLISVMFGEIVHHWINRCIKSVVVVI